MVQISQEMGFIPPSALWVCRQCLSPRTASAAQEFPVCHQILLLLEFWEPGASHCSPVQFAGFGEQHSKEKSRSCSFLHINKHKIYAWNSVYQPCSSLKETGAVGIFWSCFITHFTIYCFTQPEQQHHFYKDKVQGMYLSLQLLLQDVLEAQNALEHLPVLFSPNLPIIPLIKGGGVTH